jgi:hypothetical protein
MPSRANAFFSETPESRIRSATSMRVHNKVPLCELSCNSIWMPSSLHPNCITLAEKSKNTGSYRMHKNDVVRGKYILKN